MKLIDIVKDNFVEFHSYRQGFFYYTVPMGFVTSEEGKSTKVSGLFTVPADDIGTGTLLKRDKAINFMRWIRKAIDNNELIPEYGGKTEDANV